MQGVDPRLWDLRQLCAAFEVQVRSGCKDDAEWQRERAKLYAPPRDVSRKALAARVRPRAAPMSQGSAQAFLKSLAAEDSLYGAL